MTEGAPEFDPELTPAQKEKVALLSELDLEVIDLAIMNNCCKFWRKVARIVSAVMDDIPPHQKGVPDIFYSQRIKKLVEEGKLESQGDLRCMRYSEVRIPT